MTGLAKFMEVMDPGCVGRKLYHVRTTDLAIIGIPAFAILFVWLSAAFPAVSRAVRIDPGVMLRIE